MPLPRPSEALCHLRAALAKLDPDRAFPEHAGVLPLGLPAIDRTLAGGLARGALHEFAPAVPGQLGAVSGFALALTALSTANGQSALFIQTDFAALEGGTLYGPGLDLFGLPMQRLLCLRVPRPVDALWAFEEALKSPALGVVIAELPETNVDLTATRRLSLAARAGGGFGFLLRQRASSLATAAATRWSIASALSAPDPYGGLGRTAFDLTLSRNRRGQPGRFILWWDHDARTFIPALSLDLAAAAHDRSAAAKRHAG